MTLVQLLTSAGLAGLVLAGLGWAIWKGIGAYNRSVVRQGTLEEKKKADAETISRIIKEKEAYEDIHKTRSLTGSDAIDRL